MFNLLLAPVWSPARRYEAACERPGSLGAAVRLLLVFALMYTFTVAIGYFNGFGAVVEPVLRIPAEEYYAYEAFFALPLFFLLAIVFAGTSRLLAAALGGTAGFEADFVVYAGASVLPVLVTMWLPETVLMVFLPGLRAEPLGGFSFLPVWLDVARQALGIVWTVAISVVGLHVTERLSLLRSAVVGVLSFAVCAGIMLLFIR